MGDPDLVAAVRAEVYGDPAHVTQRLDSASLDAIFWWAGLRRTTDAADAARVMNSFADPTAERCGLAAATGDYLTWNQPQHASRAGAQLASLLERIAEVDWLPRAPTDNFILSRGLHHPAQWDDDRHGGRLLRLHGKYVITAVTYHSISAAPGSRGDRGGAVGWRQCHLQPHD